MEKMLPLKLGAGFSVGGFKLVLLSVFLASDLSVSSLPKEIATGAIVEGSMHIDPHLSLRVSHIDGSRRGLG